jgi:hypothetical protein
MRTNGILTIWQGASSEGTNEATFNTSASRSFRRLSHEKKIPYRQFHRTSTGLAQFFHSLAAGSPMAATDSLHDRVVPRADL